MSDDTCSMRTWAPRFDVPTSGPVQHVCILLWSHVEFLARDTHECSCGYTWPMWTDPPGTGQVVYCPTCGFTHAKPIHPWEDD